MAFPAKRPEGACYPRPFENETLPITPPGFCWWPAGERGKVSYRLKIMDEKGMVAYESPAIPDPVHVPDRPLAPGQYSWIVEALDENGAVVDTRAAQHFSIGPNPIEQPWIPADQLLARVPREYPRLLFPKAKLDEARATLGTTRKEAFESLTRSANAALKLTPPPEPQYDKIEDPAERRLAYQKSFGELRKYHQEGMVNLALMYLLTGEKKYGEVAKAILLGAAEWDPEGISSVLSPYGDEVGLGLARSGALAYDWLYDLMTEAEREKVKTMLIARADQVMRRLQKRDYLARPEESHSGRLPGYLIEHAIALADEPHAQVWMDYAMRIYLTVFPHWGGSDGGWAEGISYGLAYNTIYLLPVESLKQATGLDMWQRPFYQRIRSFFMYCISPLGDACPFGDMEDGAIAGRASAIRALLQFHANEYQDPVVRWWVTLLKGSGGGQAAVGALPGIALPDAVEPKEPADLPNDAAFFGVGWAALHSDIKRPEDDLFVLFKCSPYGAVSHSHCDQNTFALMKGGVSLAIAGGSRYPIHGSPFHLKYTQQTMAHNGVLVNGQGQFKNTDALHGGTLADFQTTKHLGYACGDAAKCYGDRLTRARRRVLMIRPSVVLIIDDLEAPQPADYQWLLHARQEFELDEAGQSLVSRNGEESMAARLLTPGGFSFSQTDEWPMNPKEGYPKTTAKEPPKQWHFAASTREKSAARRIAAVLVVNEKGQAPDCRIAQPSDAMVEIQCAIGADRVSARISLAADGAGRAPILEARYEPASGEAETISAR
ncbi:MAG: DUF4962 domain-containing protein [Candidatus Sumerlaeota bacterium]|nr:DUF4962 domain-containing protein [Candidatus Sumerlaeota bacterium]